MAFKANKINSFFASGDFLSSTNNLCKELDFKSGLMEQLGNCTDLPEPSLLAYSKLKTQTKI